MCCLLVLITTISTTGCEHAHNAFRFVQDKSEPVVQLVDPDPEVDLEDTDLLDESETRLATLFGPVDQRLGDLGSTLDAMESLPPAGWFRNLRERYPFVDVAVATDLRGDVIAGEGLDEAGSAALLALLERGESLDEKRILLVETVEEANGARMYVANRLIVDNVWKGLVVASFDWAELAAYSPNPAELLVLTPEKLVWSGEWDASDAPLQKFDWMDIIDDSVAGELESDGTEFTWLVRYLGEERIIYATPSIE
jgi:hypothetical protein